MNDREKMSFSYYSYFRIIRSRPPADIYCHLYKHFGSQNLDGRLLPLKVYPLAFLEQRLSFNSLTTKKQTTQFSSSNF